ncbi:hypothetical protein QOT17_008435 [Balamuthia mandrillaris]
MATTASTPPTTPIAQPTTTTQPTGPPGGGGGAAAAMDTTRMAGYTPYTPYTPYVPTFDYGGPPVLPSYQYPPGFDYYHPRAPYATPDTSAIATGPLREPLLDTNTWKNQGTPGTNLPAFGGYWRPRTDILDLGNVLRVECELPGVNEDTIHVEADQSTLIISSLKPQSRAEQRGIYLQNERHFGSFYRKLSLPSFIDNNSITAVMNEGVLIITLPKSRDTSTRPRVAIQRLTDVTKTGAHYVGEPGWK